jgi:nucleoside-diphosphate kinase
MIEKTLGIIKPDAVKAGHVKAIINRIEKEGFIVLNTKETQLTKAQAEEFYAIHKGKPFFDELVTYMTSGPVVAMDLQKENAIKAWRDLMGNTDPALAAPDTLRKLYGTSKGINSFHGSDAPETAHVELKFFFHKLD